MLDLCVRCTLSVKLIEYSFDENKSWDVQFVEAFIEKRVTICMISKFTYVIEQV